MKCVDDIKNNFDINFRKSIFFFCGLPQVQTRLVHW